MKMEIITTMLKLITTVFLFYAQIQLSAIINSLQNYQKENIPLKFLSEPIGIEEKLHFMVFE